MAATLTSALSSMEVMLDALMQRGIGKPKEPTKPKEEEEPPALPTRPTGRGRLPALQRPGGTAAAPWIHRPSPATPPATPPAQEEEDEEKCLVNQELERRAAKAEEEMKQKEELISTLQRQVEHYESRLSECEVRMKSVEEELQRQVTSLQMAHTAGGRRDGSTKHSHESSSSSSRGSLPPSQPSSVRRQQRDSDPATVAVAIVAAAAEERKTPADTTPAVNQLASREFPTEREAASEQNVRAVAAAVAEASRLPPPLPSPSSVKSVEELKTLKRQFATWKKEYEAKLKKTKAELKRLAHAEKKSGGNGGGGDGHGGHQRRCGWWRIRAPKCRAPNCCSFKLPSPKSCCCCCFRR